MCLAHSASPLHSREQRLLYQHLEGLPGEPPSDESPETPTPEMTRSDVLHKNQDKLADLKQAVGQSSDYYGINADLAERTRVLSEAVRSLEAAYTGAKPEVIFHQDRFTVEVQRGGQSIVFVIGPAQKKDSARQVNVQTIRENKTVVTALGTARDSRALAALVRQYLDSNG